MMLFQNKNIQNYKNFIVLVLEFVFAIILFLVCARHVFETTNLIVWDELGYWGNAAYLAGYDWSSVVMANCGYYSYGYSLILSLLLRLFAASGYAYQVAIFINAIFSVGSYFLANYVGCSFFGKEKKHYVVIIAFAVSIYGNNITQTCFAWPETLLIFLFWTIVALFTSIQHKYSLFKVLLLCFVLTYMFFVHTRTIGIVIAGFFSILILLIKSNNESIRKKIGQIIFIGCLMAVIFVLGQYIRNYVKDGVWKVSADVSLANTSSVLFDDTVKKFTIKGVLEIIKTFMNRFYYWGCVSYFFVFVCIKEICVALYEEFKGKKINIVFFFLILSMLGNFGVLSLTLSFQGTYQALLYGRYVDNMIGPFFLLGLLFFITKNKVIDKVEIIELFVYEAITLLLFYNANSIEIKSDYFVANCNVDFYKYWIGTANGGYNYFEFMMIAILVYSCLLLIRFLLIHKIMIPAWIGIVIVLCSYSKSKYDLSESIFYLTFTNCDDMEKTIYNISEYCKGYEEIYFYRDNNWRCNPLEMWAQFQMFERKVIDISSLEELSNCMLLVPRELVHEDTYLPSIEVNGEVLIEDKYIALYKLP